jgi:hypothetical protein
MHLVYGIGNNFFYGCIYRKVKDPHILDGRRRIDNRMTKRKAQKDKQRSTKHYKENKDQATQIPLKLE